MVAEAATNWLDIEGLVNVRDLGGRTTVDGRRVQNARVLRSDNLQDLTAASVTRLLDELGVTDVIDLRTNRERRFAGPTLLQGRVNEHALTLYPEDDPDAPRPPWSNDLAEIDHTNPQQHAAGMASHYLEYLQARADHLLAALRVVSKAEGAVVIHCAAGKDRTGTTCAMILGAVGVPDEQIVADYAASNERVPAILARLGPGATAGSADPRAQVAAQSTPPEIMIDFLDMVRRDYGGIPQYLRAEGWSEHDQALLVAKLLD